MDYICREATLYAVAQFVYKCSPPEGSFKGTLQQFALYTVRG